MTDQEVDEFVNRVMRERMALLAKIATAAKAVVPVLLDAGKVNSAKELQEPFFLFDVNEQSLSEFIKNNPAAAIDVLMRKLDR